MLPRGARLSASRRRVSVAALRIRTSSTTPNHQQRGQQRGRQPERSRRLDELDRFWVSDRASSSRPTDVRRRSWSDLVLDLGVDPLHHLIATVALVDVSLERIEEDLAFFDRGLSHRSAVRPKPIALHDTREPAPNLVQILPDFLGLLEGVIFSEALELDLLYELGFAFLDDLVIFLITQD